MKILVTGVAGAIGSNLSERLISLGHNVIGIDSFNDYYDVSIKKTNAHDIEKKGVMVINKNLVTDDISKEIKNVEMVYHLAAQPGISLATLFDDYLKNNIIATYKLIESVKNLPTLKAFINGSTSSVYGPIAKGNEGSETKPNSYYGVTKLGAEQLALSYFRGQKLPVINLRLFSVYGERERPDKFFYKLIKSIYENSELNMFEGSDKHMRSYTYVGDILDGCVSVLGHIEECLGQTFNLGNGKSVSTKEALKTVEELMGKKANIKIVPARLGDQKETKANIEKARKILGYNPRTDLRTGLKKQIDWYGEKIFRK